MVVRLVLPCKTLSTFYGLVMEEEQKSNLEAKVWSTQELFGEERLGLIEHESVRYRLRITKQGKLVLNK